MGKESTYLFEKESISKAMIALAVPAILVSVVELIYSMVNQYFVAQLKNSAMIAAMSTSTSLDILIDSVGVCIGIGGASYLGRILGAKSDEKAVYETVRTSMTLCILMTLVHMLLGLAVLKPYIYWQTEDPEVISYAVSYGAIQIVTMVLYVIRTTCVHLLRAGGDIRYPTNIITISVWINILLDPLFMFEWGLNLGIVGAALATAVARAFTAVCCLRRLHSHKTAIYWKPLDLHMDKEIVKEILKVGASCYVRNVLPGLSSAIYNKQVFRFSTDFVAGCAVGKNAAYFLNFFIQGAANGYLPFASYNYGAKNHKRLYQSMVWSLSVLTAYSLVTDVLLWRYAPAYIGLFAANAASVTYGVKYILAYTLSLPVYATYYILTVSLQASGKGRESMILSVSRQGLFYMPLILLLPKWTGEKGIYLTQPLSDWLSVLLALYLSWGLLKEIYERRTN